MKYSQIHMLSPARLTLLFAVLSLALGLLLQEVLVTAHMDDTAYWFSSDGPQYYRLYQTFLESGYLDSEFFRLSNPAIYALLGVGMPAFILGIADGSMWLTLLLNISFMCAGLYALLKSLPNDRPQLVMVRWKFLVLFLLFPYVIGGLFAVNKEVFCLASALFFSAYLLGGKKRHLCFTLLAAFMCRYYLLVTYLVVAGCLRFNLTRRRSGRIFLWGCALLFSLCLSAILTVGVPGYSADENLIGEGAASNFFNQMTMSGIYFFLYPLKLLALITSKTLNFVKGNLDFENRLFDHTELLVSIYSLFVMGLAGWILAFKKPVSVSKRFLWLGFLSPYILLWAPTYHWRYYVFSVVFWLVGILLNKGSEENSLSKSNQLTSPLERRET